MTAVAPVIIQGGGMWVGWPGTFFKEGVIIPESHPNDKSPTAKLKSDKVGRYILLIVLLILKVQ